MQWQFSSNCSQVWYCTQNADGSWSIVNPYTNYALENPGASTTNGTQMDQWSINNGANQKWTITSLNSNGISSPYKIANQSSGKALNNTNSTATAIFKVVEPC